LDTVRHRSMVANDSNFARADTVSHSIMIIVSVQVMES
jgi:hypothetical protein